MGLSIEKRRQTGRIDRQRDGQTGMSLGRSRGAKQKLEIGIERFGFRAKKNM